MHAAFLMIGSQFADRFAQFRWMTASFRNERYQHGDTTCDLESACEHSICNTVRERIACQSVRKFSDCTGIVACSAISKSDIIAPFFGKRVSHAGPRSWVRTYDGSFLDTGSVKDGANAANNRCRNFNAEVIHIWCKVDNVVVPIPFLRAVTDIQESEEVTYSYVDSLNGLADSAFLSALIGNPCRCHDCTPAAFCSAGTHCVRRPESKPSKRRFVRGRAYCSSCYNKWYRSDRPPPADGLAKGAALRITKRSRDAAYFTCSGCKLVHRRTPNTDCCRYIDGRPVCMRCREKHRYRQSKRKGAGASEYV